MQHQRKGKAGNSTPRDEDAHVRPSDAVRVRELICAFLGPRAPFQLDGLLKWMLYSLETRDDLRRVGKVVELLEQVIELHRRCHPEQCPRWLAGIIENPVQGAHRHADHVAGLRLEFAAVEPKVELAFVDADEFVLVRM